MRGEQRDPSPNWVTHCVSPSSSMPALVPNPTCAAARVRARCVWLLKEKIKRQKPNLPRRWSCLVLLASDPRAVVSVCVVGVDPAARTFLQRVQSSKSVTAFRLYVSKTKGADKLAVFFWMGVDFAWCQEQGEWAMGMAAFMMLCCLYTMSVAHSSPHEVLHCCSVLLWASGNISWMYMELGQARVRQRYSEYHGVGAEREQWLGFKVASLVFFSLALAIELIYFAYLRHMPYFEGAWESDPVTASVVRRNRRLSLSEEGEAPTEAGTARGYGATEGGSNRAPVVEQEVHTVVGVPWCELHSTVDS